MPFDRTTLQREGQELSAKDSKLAELFAALFANDGFGSANLFCMRAAALSSFGKRKEGIFRFLLHAAEADDARLREDVRLQLNSLPMLAPGKSAVALVPALLEILASKDADTRMLALDLFARWNLTGSARQLLEVLSGDDDPRVRACAARALGDLDPAAHAPAVAASIRGSGAAAEGIAQALDLFLDWETVKVTAPLTAAIASGLEPALASADERERAAAASVVESSTMLQSKFVEAWLAQLLPATIALLADPAATVRAAAAKAITSSAGVPKKFPPLDAKAITLVQTAAASADAAIARAATAVTERLAKTKK